MIDYGRLGKSIVYYESIGYSRIEAPWWVPKGIMEITCPKDVDFEESLYYLPKNKKCLVASGEQSLLYLANQGLLTKTKIQTVTPCFRDEVQGPTRRKFFMKNELMIPYSSKITDMNRVVEDAMGFFETQVKYPDKLKRVPTDEGFDIEYNGIEIGSYGIRKCQFMNWIYGTGLAEPRMSRVVYTVEESGV